MSRALAVIAIAALCGALFGIDESTWAAQDDAALEAARRQFIATRVAKISVGSTVKIERSDGSKIEGVLTAKTQDTVTVEVYQRRSFRRPRLISTETIQFGDLKDVKKPLTNTQVALITTGVVVGTCTALALVAAANLDVKSSPPVPSSEEEQTPALSGTGKPSAAEQGTSIVAP